MASTRCAVCVSSCFVILAVLLYQAVRPSHERRRRRVARATAHSSSPLPTPHVEQTPELPQRTPELPLAVLKSPALQTPALQTPVLTTSARRASALHTPMLHPPATTPVLRTPGQLPPMLVARPAALPARKPDTPTPKVALLAQTPTLPAVLLAQTPGGGAAPVTPARTPDVHPPDGSLSHPECQWPEQARAAGMAPGSGEYGWPGDSESRQGPGGLWRQSERKLAPGEHQRIMSQTHDQRQQDKHLQEDRRGWAFEFAALSGVLKSTAVGKPLVWKDSATGLQIALVQMLTHTDPATCQLIRIAMSRGWPLNLVGFGADVKRARNIGWVRGVTRQAVLADAVAGIPDNVVVLVTDSFDVAFQTTPAEFASRWKHQESKAAGRDHVWYSAETGCWPFGILGGSCPEWPGGCSRFGPSRGAGRPRFLNAGVFAARADTMRWWFDGLANLSTSTPRRCLYDDQAPHGWHWVLTRAATGRAQLDYSEWIAKNTNCAADELEYDADRRLFRHRRFHDSRDWDAPVAVHTNGDKTPLKFFMDALDSGAAPRGCASVDGVPKRFSQLCGASPARTPLGDGMRYHYHTHCRLPAGS
eukprot:TRINITY_DN19363_c0_g1_i1.p1 TRINITY_DN19363_c0_g1~~TRINITY_DN19363_c0_g1_i1.p1  ORF type:complete len:589 (+),score=91.36 TRINITY_DN19363_c0_g1_i1:50-1816(+)